ncbi:hypothetical protein DIPPA_54632 [Diplonema papillatum]|nr:hypothetical protein DIPPA_54632 [Diplonema papillatum]
MENVCRHWYKGKCRLGEKCKFDHPSVVSPVVSEVSTNKKPKWCRHARLEDCRFNGGCVYWHVEEWESVSPGSRPRELSPPGPVEPMFPNGQAPQGMLPPASFAPRGAFDKGYPPVQDPCVQRNPETPMSQGYTQPPPPGLDRQRWQYPGGRRPPVNSNHLPVHSPHGPQPHCEASLPPNGTLPARGPSPNPHHISHNTSQHHHYHHHHVHHHHHHNHHPHDLEHQFHHQHQHHARHSHHVFHQAAPLPPHHQPHAPPFDAQWRSHNQPNLGPYAAPYAPPPPVPSNSQPPAPSAPPLPNQKNGTAPGDKARGRNPHNGSPKGAACSSSHEDAADQPAPTSTSEHAKSLGTTALAPPPPPHGMRPQEPSEFQPPAYEAAYYSSGYYQGYPPQVQEYYGPVDGLHDPYMMGTPTSYPPSMMQSEYPPY